MQHCGLKKNLSALLAFLRGITDNHIFAYASQASFFVVISGVPFVMILLNVFQAVLPVEKSYLMQLAGDFLPSQLENISTRMINELYTNVSVSLVSVTTVFLIWAASRGVKAISVGLKLVYKTNVNDNYFKSTGWSLLYTVLFMVGIVVSMVLLLFGNTIAQFIDNNVPYISPVVDIIFMLRHVVFIIYLTLVFMTAYKFLGKSKIKFRRQFFGAFAAAVGWILYSFFYSLYIENISNFSAIYGPLAAVIFLMLWLWFCMIMLLFGAQINMWLFEKNYYIGKIIKKVLQSRK